MCCFLFGIRPESYLTPAIVQLLTANLYRTVRLHKLTTPTYIHIQYLELHLQACARWKQYKSDLLAFTFLWNCHKHKGRLCPAVFKYNAQPWMPFYCSVLQWKVTSSWRGNKPQIDLIFFRSKTLIISDYVLSLALFVLLCFKEVHAWIRFYVNSRTSAEHSSLL